MDIDKALKEHHERTRKRKLESVSDADEAREGAKLREPDSANPGGNEEDDDEEGRFFGSGLTQREEQIWDMMNDDDDDNGPEVLSEKRVLSIFAQLERKIAANERARAKNPDDPIKFADSETDLHAAIKASAVLSEAGQYVRAIISKVSVLVALIGHENTDIATDALEVLADILDADYGIGEEEFHDLADAMIEADFIPLSASNLARYDENEESDRDGVYHTLACYEEMSRFEAYAQLILGEQEIVHWLHKRIDKKETIVSQNKQYCVELLALMVGGKPACHMILIKADFIDLLLRLLSPFRKRNPIRENNEEEIMENAFDTLCALLTEPEGKSEFVSAEGIELCLLMIQLGKKSSNRAIGTLDFLVSGNADASEACDHLVEAGGLKVLFTVFMKRKLSGMAKEHLLSIFAAMLQWLPADSASRIRLLAKFCERDYEKLNKLMEAYDEYAARTAATEREIERKRSEMTFHDDDERQDQEMEWYMDRVGNGLYRLQLVTIILAWMFAEDRGAGAAITHLLEQRHASVAAGISAYLQEYTKYLDSEEHNNTKAMIEALVDCLPRADGLPRQSN